MALTFCILLCSLVLLSSAVPHLGRGNSEPEYHSTALPLSSNRLLEHKIPETRASSTLRSEQRAFLQTSSKAGLTLDSCKEDFDCEGLRLCYEVVDGGVDLCKKGIDCFCRPVQLEQCATNQDCIKREVCVQTDAIRESICVSKEAEQQFSNLSEVNASPGTPSATPSATPSSTSESVESSTPSASPATSLTTSPSLTPAMESTSPTANASPASVAPLASPSQTFQMAPSASASEEQLETPAPIDPVCIDARALDHMDAADLVYDTHRWTTVLCDANESCATPGHMVKFKGRAMMMKTFCDIVGCEKRSMHVNSPRYKRGMIINSNTDGLQYTAFAAKYESRLEEAVISAAVRMGM